MNVKTTTLERMTFAAQQIISREIVNDFGNTPDVRFIEYAAHELAFQLRQHVYGEHLDQRTIRYPATWRDAVKDRFYAWLRSGHWPYGADLLEPHYPVKWHEISIDVTALYPKISMPQERHSIKVAQIHDTSTESQRLWFDMRERGLFDAIYRLYSEGHMGQSWALGRKALHAIQITRDPYLFEHFYQIGLGKTEATLFGMKAVIDDTVPSDTIELRDKDDRIVGKIYNIG